jgi:hypothetical protein
VNTSGLLLRAAGPFTEGVLDAMLGARQLSPYRTDDPSQPLDAVDPGPRVTPDEKHSGMYGAAAVESGRRLLFAGLGAWENAMRHSIDSATTPFLRALWWDVTIQDGMRRRSG